ncbi:MULTISPECIES: LysR substrate-binding domain-containing protein [Solimonas]|uniref:LysR substrate-binding domain-containing protein n=1 Tax=Solimonas TaxID=413435 RepID=UPI0003611570|nr:MULTISPECIES: LysR substrate-binding domain-containing protein [Solimonas]
MKFRRLPPLHTLQAFEAAARTLSFKVAAEELHLTASAISHQIKALEGFLGFALFRRGNRSLELSDGGRDYLAVVRDTLQRLRDGSHRVAQRHGRARLKISMGPFIGSEVILPALSAFRAQHPDIDVHIETTLRPVDLLHEDLDIALRFGDGRWPKLGCVPLLSMSAVPVCAPALARELRRRGPGNLDGVTLIHSSPMPNAWADWARLAGIDFGPPKNDLWLDSYLAILRAAEQGLGLTLGLVPMVNPWLHRRKLAQPWPKLHTEIPQRYYLLYREHDDDRHEVRAFRDWLQAELPALLA